MDEEQEMINFCIVMRILLKIFLKNKCINREEYAGEKNLQKLQIAFYIDTDDRH